MKILQILSLTFFLSISGFLACESILDPKDFKTAPKIVVHCFFTPGRPWQLELSASRNVLNDALDTVWLDRAVINISGDDGTFLDEFEYQGNGKYINSKFLPEAGVSYTLSVHHEGYTSVEANDHIPRKTDINLSLEQVENNGKTWMRLTASPLSPELFTNIIISNQIGKAYLNEPGDTLVFEELAFIVPEPNYIDLFQHYNSGSQLSQKLFLKKQTAGAFSILSQGGFRKTSDINLMEAKSGWHFFFGSDAFYQYQYSIESAQAFPENDGTSVFFKNDYFSNINKGYGIFAGFNLNIYENAF